jgi:uncharacterized membrane protein (DUF4010 family)
MITIYLFVLGTPKTINLIIDEYLFILAFLISLSVAWYLKRKLQKVEIIDFYKQNNLTLKSTLSFFLLFQVVDYIFEDGFIGMISQWFLYWIIGMISVQVFTILNLYKNLKFYMRTDK